VRREADTLKGGEDRVETYRRFLDAASRRSAIEAVALCTNDVILATPLIEAWGAGVLRGHDGVRTWIRRIEDEWAFLVAKPQEASERGEWVQGRCQMSGRGKASPSEIEFELHHAVRFREGRIAELHAFLTPDRAVSRIGSGARA
jgi:ketosteroid isomerase-like protein